MKNFTIKIISVLSAFAILVSSVSVSARASDYDAQPVSWWDSYIIKGLGLTGGLGNLDDVFGIPGSLLNTLALSVGDLVSGVVCVVSSDKLHHGSVVDDGERGGIDKDGKPFVYCRCKYCGDKFKGYASDLAAAYDDYVAELPAAGYTSAGKLIYQFSISDIVGSFSFDARTFDSISAFPCVLSGSGYVGTSTFSCFNDSTLYSCFDDRSGSGSNWQTYRFSANLHVPVEGSYVRISSPLIEYRYLLDTGYVSGERSYSGSSGKAYYYFLGDTISFSISESGRYSTRYREWYAHLPVYEITLSADTPFSSTYNITTRPTSITGGNYGIIGDNGQITTVTNNNQIVNETNNTYYNPATGETSTITDWSYDYSDRSYNLTLEGGDTSTVTYGDENITITETTINESGDTIINNYTIYYIIEGSGSGTGPATHTHDWRETSVMDAACIQAGRRVYTCDVCGDTKSETISALGHNWLVLRTVNTEYDEDGTLVTEGYVLYQCDRCQEQYKTTSTSSRPPPGGGTTSGSSTVLDDFPDFVDMLLEMLRQLPRLFSGFVAFLNAMFAYIPEEIIFLLTFGVAAVVLIGIIKAVRG